MFRFRIVPFLIIFLLFVPVILWNFLPKTHLEVLVLDKTVPDTSYREHRGLFWVLNHGRYIKGDGSPYRYQTDYYGYHPEGKDSTIRSLPDVLPPLHLIYLADTYGVYGDDFYEVPLGERSQLIYGGLKKEEIDSIQEALYGGATLVAEFNTFGTPTHPVDRDLIYPILGLRWSGWIGRYFSSLGDKEVPPWAIRNYQNQYNREWAYHKGGFLFLHEDDDVVVLELDKHTTSTGSKLSLSEEGIEHFGIKRGATYSYWFDIVIPEPDTEVLATYSIHLTQKGEELLQSKGIPITFPAILKNKTLHYSSYYFAGDYADYEQVSNIHHIAYWDYFRRWFSIDGLENLNAFYWRIYVPVMKNIFSRAKEEREEIPKKQVYTDGAITLISRVKDCMMEIYQEGRWIPFPIKGVNLGTALPGTWFTQFPERESDYYRWMVMMGEMNVNTLRIYTLLNPAFYRALYNYNLENPTKPIYLLQEIWPEEHPEQDNLLAQDYLETFFQEIEYVVDAIHGVAHIPEREYRAHGRFYVDVSPYLLGYLVGREFEPHEVLATDLLNEGFSFNGEYFSTSEGATPTEGWLAATCDYLLSYQEKTYGWQHPVAIVSWPPLDPMEHDT